MRIFSFARGFDAAFSHSLRPLRTSIAAATVRGTMRIALPCLIMLAALAGCGGSDHDQQLSGSYRLVAIDLRENMIVCRRIAGAYCVGDKLPGPSVFAAGANKRYVTIARHPMAIGSASDRRVTEYYYVIRHRDDEALHDGDLIGPLNEAQFAAAQARLQLPTFSRDFDDLR